MELFSKQEKKHNINFQFEYKLKKNIKKIKTVSPKLIKKITKIILN